MNIYELKEKVWERLSTLVTSNSYLEKDIDGLFAEFDRSNKEIESEKEPKHYADRTKLTEENMQYVLNKISKNDILRQAMKEEIEGVKAEIIKLKQTEKEIAIQNQCNKTAVDILHKHVSTKFMSIDKRIESICVGEKPVSNPKQERFYYEYNSIYKTNQKLFNILDSELKLCFDNLYLESECIEICKALNSMDK